MAVGLGIWYCLMLAGISGTVAGVIIAALAPLTTRKSGGTLQLSERVEDILLPLTAYIIVPLFVFTSTGLVFENVTLAGGGAKTVFFGVLAGLLCGKPLGIILATWLSTKMRLAQKPASLSWWHIGGAGFLAGIGFTISLFVADLSFGHLPQLRDAAITGVFIASILGGIIGSLMLRMQRPSP